MTESPCIKICQLDDAAICLGCYRSAMEIGEWWEASAHRQHEILVNAQKRQADYAARRNKGLTSNTATTNQ